MTLAAPGVVEPVHCDDRQFRAGLIWAEIRIPPLARRAALPAGRRISADGWSFARSVCAYLTASRSVFPALKEGTFEAAMEMLSPVRGLRP